MTDGNERHFDEKSESPPPALSTENKEQAVTPWRRAIDHTITGMALSVITLNFLALDYLLPTIGILLLLLGFRTLRKENAWFQSCWWLTMLRAACFFPMLMLNATIYHRAVYDSAFGSFFHLVNLAVQFLMICCFWRAMKAVEKKTGTSSPNGSGGALLAWYVVFILLALVQYQGIVIGLAMIIGYLLIIRSLYHFSETLEKDGGFAAGCEASEKGGVAAQGTRVFLSDRKLVLGLVAVLAVGISSGYVWGSRYRMDWQAETATQSAAMLAVKEELLALGYPPAALADLSHEDLLASKRALQVVSQEHQLPVNPGREMRTVEGNTTYITTVHEVKELLLTDVAVQLPGETQRWKIFHHFRWTVNPGFAGTEALQVWPAYRENEGWADAGSLTGQVLYDHGGMVYTAPFYTLADESNSSDSFFWGSREVTDVVATFSMPRKGEAHRGYVSYGIKAEKDGWMVNSWVNYTHQKSRLQYPVLTAAETRKAYGWNDAYPFTTVQHALQFFQTDEGIDLLSDRYR